ncbi:hypothetical protein LR48_Vigan10g067700 [Vigna angularis]|uniref:Uncharacterized protein n=1 Tax=Phaseolus angularis TaxID=3914 RepID=A0A0L9VI91_PHAAN|nr:hypothetical protein LR48_Vigan10g067700 [Vigna angularis]
MSHDILQPKDRLVWSNTGAEETSRSASQVGLSPRACRRCYCAGKAETDVGHPFAFDGCPTSVDECGISVEGQSDIPHPFQLC